jgi:hypothetical protein
MAAAAQGAASRPATEEDELNYERVAEASYRNEREQHAQFLHVWSVKILQHIGLVPMEAAPTVALIWKVCILCLCSLSCERFMQSAKLSLRRLRCHCCGLNMPCIMRSW